ncbi:MAG: DUF2461 domain-containing protein [Bacillota bacterium]
MGAKADRFNGFLPETAEFLNDLRANNNKPWFEAHRQDYQEYLIRPLQDLVADLGGFMYAIDPLFELTPAVNKTISRIYRDTRFSRDKSPYKSAMWITFKRPGKDWKDAPAYFLEISPESYRYGMGFYGASKETMDGLRKVIDEQPDRLEKATDFYPKQQEFVIEGETYKKAPGEDKPEHIMLWYRRKNLYLVCNREIDDRFFHKNLVEDLTRGFNLLAPLYRFLREVKDQSARQTRRIR